MRHLAILGSILIGLSACNWEDFPNGPPVDPPVIPDPPKHVSFADMRVGQMSKYVLFNASGYHADDGYKDYHYLPDTLMVEITDVENGRFKWEERLSEHSSGSAIGQDTSYWVYLSGENILFVTDTGRYRGYLFHYFDYGDLTLEGMHIPLNSFQNQAADIIGWKTTLAYQESYRTAYDPEFILFGKTYTDINIIVDNVLMQRDGPGKTYVYNATSGIIRTAEYSQWTGNGWGWDLLRER